MKIGELAAQTQHTTETIRYYEKIGLLTPARRLENNYRTYGEAHVSRLVFIRHCRTLNLGLDEIRLLLESIDDERPEAADRAHAMIHHHLEAVEMRMRELMHLREQLRGLAGACGGHHDGHEPCGLLMKLRDPDES